jgi:hypothetical protein
MDSRAHDVVEVVWWSTAHTSLFNWVSVLPRKKIANNTNTTRSLRWRQYYYGGVSGGNGQILKIWKFSLQTVGSCTCGLDARVSVQLVILQKTARSHTLQFAVRSFTDLCLEKSGLLVHIVPYVSGPSCATLLIPEPSCATLLVWCSENLGWKGWPDFYVRFLSYSV